MFLFYAFFGEHPIQEEHTLLHLDSDGWTAEVESSGAPLAAAPAEMPEIPGGDLEPTAPQHDAAVKQEDIVAIQRLLEELEVKVDAATAKKQKKKDKKRSKCRERSRSRSRSRKRKKRRSATSSSQDRRQGYPTPSEEHAGGGEDVEDPNGANGEGEVDPYLEKDSRGATGEDDVDPEPQEDLDAADDDSLAEYLQNCFKN